MDFQAIVNDVTTNWMLYLSMPFVAAAIGYVTKLVAIRMMFEPIEFVGVKPYFGWQGIIPRKAATMASIACDTMTRELVKPEDIFARLDADRVAREIEKPLLEAVDEIARDVLGHYQPGLWESLPETVRKMIIGRIQAQSPEIVKQLMNEIKRDVNKVFDLKDMVVTNLLSDKELLNRIFREVGHKEFKFIANSGIYFGFAIGCVQAVTWALTHSTLVMPAFGLFTGWFTDWLALKIIFNPKEPTRYLFFEWQGLFLKNRKEVAAEYGRLIAKQIITPDKIINAVLRGPLSDRIFLMINKEVKKLVDDQVGIAKALVVFAVGSRQYQEMKEVIARKVMERLPETMKHMEAYAADAMDLERTVVEKMQQLTPVQFEGLLRPAFQQDEWILITVGAVLGFLVGEMQVHIMTHFASGAMH